MLTTLHPFQTLARFARRHRWSLPLSVASAVSFAHLASEMREGEMDAFDTFVERAVTSWRGHLDGMMLSLTALGGLVGMGAVSIAIVAALAARKHAREVRFFLAGAGGSLALNVALKLAFHRARPDARLDYLVPTPSDFSFPSGHAMGSAGVLASAVVLLVPLGAPRPLRHLAAALCIAIVVGVSLSRVYFGVHYPSDVVGGVLAAGAWVSAITGWVYPRALEGERVEGAETPRN